MKKTIKIFLAAALLFSCQLSNYNGVSAQDAEYQLIRRSFTVNNDGTIDIRYRKELKLLRNRAITAYADKGETFILYNPAIDQLTINESYTVRPDGSRVYTPANAFVDQLPSECQDCGRYNGIRERAVIHTALEYNCIVVLDYTIRRRTPKLDELIILSEDCPVKRYEVAFEVKANQQDGPSFSFETKGLPKSHKYSTNQSNSWQWVLTDLPQSYKDSYLPSPYSLYPSIKLHYGSDNNVIDNEDNLAESAHVVMELFDQDPVKYVTKIRDYVVDYIKTNEIPLSLLAYRTSAARETFLSACGTPADKNILLAAMLRQAGFRAYADKNHVFVTISENGADISYRISAAMKTPLRPDGAAIDEQRTIEIDANIPWQGRNIGAGYMLMELPVEEGSISINPSLLTSDRKAPLRVRNCNEKYHYTIVTPRDKKHTLVGKPVDISYSKNGLGSIRISIKQNQRGEVEIIRELDINVENGVVTPDQYKVIRHMMQDWTQYRTITIRG